MSPSVLIGTVRGAPQVDELGDRILDAAFAEFERHGLRRTNLDEVARRAGVARITVYRRFATKTGLLHAVVLREAARFLDELDLAMAAVDAIDEKVSEAFVLTIRTAERHPLLQGMLAVEPETIVRAVTLDGGPLLVAATAYLADHIAEGQRAGLLPDYDPAPVAEVVARVVQSFALTRTSTVDLDDDEALRAFARHHLAPLLRPN